MQKKRIRIIDTPWLLLVMKVRPNMAILTYCGRVCIVKCWGLILWRDVCSFGLPTNRPIAQILQGGWFFFLKNEFSWGHFEVEHMLKSHMFKKKNEKWACTHNLFRWVKNPLHVTGIILSSHKEIDQCWTRFQLIVTNHRTNSHSNKFQ